MSSQVSSFPWPARARTTGEARLDAVWLRVERQILTALPPLAISGVLFAIRIELSPRRTVLEDPAARTGFARTLATMDDAVATYKRLAAVRPRLFEAARS